MIEPGEDEPEQDQPETIEIYLQSMVSTESTTDERTAAIKMLGSVLSSSQPPKGAMIVEKIVTFIHQRWPQHKQGASSTLLLQGPLKHFASISNDFCRTLVQSGLYQTLLHEAIVSRKGIHSDSSLSKSSWVDAFQDLAKLAKANEVVPVSNMNEKEEIAQTRHGFSLEEDDDPLVLAFSPSLTLDQVLERILKTPPNISDSTKQVLHSNVLFEILLHCKRVVALELEHQHHARLSTAELGSSTAYFLIQCLSGQVLLDESPHDGMLMMCHLYLDLYIRDEIPLLFHHLFNAIEDRSNDAKGRSKLSIVKLLRLGQRSCHWYHQSLPTMVTRRDIWIHYHFQVPNIVLATAWIRCLTSLAHVMLDTTQKVNWFHHLFRHSNLIWFWNHSSSVQKTEAQWETGLQFFNEYFRLMKRFETKSKSTSSSFHLSALLKPYCHPTRCSNPNNPHSIAFYHWIEQVLIHVPSTELLKMGWKMPQLMEFHYNEFICPSKDHNIMNFRRVHLKCLLAGALHHRLDCRAYFLDAKCVTYFLSKLSSYEQHFVVASSAAASSVDRENEEDAMMDDFEYRHDEPDDYSIPMNEALVTASPASSLSNQLPTLNFNLKCLSISRMPTSSPPTTGLPLSVVQFRKHQHEQRDTLSYDEETHALMLLFLVTMVLPLPASETLDPWYCVQYPELLSKLVGQNLWFSLATHVQNVWHNSQYVVGLAIQAQLKTIHDSSCNLQRAMNLLLPPPPFSLSHQGDTLSGHPLLVDKESSQRHAQGAFGTVYSIDVPWLGVMSDSGSPRVAIKVLDKAQRSNERLAFVDVYHEIKTLERLRGLSGSCQLYSYGHTKSAYIMLMEYCPENLKEWRLAQSKLSTSQCLTLFAQICQHVKEIHDRGIVHCDLKCENILRRANGSLCVADFGEAMLLSRKHSKRPRSFDGEKRSRGTDCIKSPEMLRLQPSASSLEHDKVDDISSGTDVWSLGTLLFELVVGEYCFTHDNWGAFFTHVTSRTNPVFDSARVAEVLNTSHVWQDARKDENITNSGRYLVELLEFILQRNVPDRPSIHALLQKINTIQAALALEKQTIETPLNHHREPHQELPQTLPALAKALRLAPGITTTTGDTVDHDDSPLVLRLTRQLHFMSTSSDLTEMNGIKLQQDGFDACICVHSCRLSEKNMALKDSHDFEQTMVEYPASGDKHTLEEFSTRLFLHLQQQSSRLSSCQTLMILVQGIPAKDSSTLLSLVLAYLMQTYALTTFDVINLVFPDFKLSRDTFRLLFQLEQQQQQQSLKDVTSQCLCGAVRFVNQASGSESIPSSQLLPLNVFCHELEGSYLVPFSDTKEEEEEEEVEAQLRYEWIQGLDTPSSTECRHMSHLHVSPMDVEWMVHQCSKCHYVTHATLISKSPEERSRRSSFVVSPASLARKGLMDRHTRRAFYFQQLFRNHSK